MKRTNVSKTITELYGTGHFNPRSFEHRPNRSRRRLYAWALGLFLLSVALATALGLYLFARTPDSFTGERIVLVGEGNTNVGIAKDELYSLRITNNEEVDLTNVELFIGYAEGKQPGEKGSTMGIVKAGEGEEIVAINTWAIGTIKDGESKVFPLTMRFSGQEGTNVVLQFALNFQPKGFSSNLSTKLEQSFILGQSAVGFNIQGPGTAGVGSEVTLTVSIDQTLEGGAKADDWSLSLSYPENFKILSIEPKQNNSDPWRVGDLPVSAGMYKLTMIGTVSGKAGDKLTIAAELKPGGTDGPVIKKEKEIIIQSTVANIAIAATPAAGKKLQWNEQLNYKVTVNNTGAEALTDATVSVAMRGEDFWSADKIKINNNGFFEGGSVIWNLGEIKSGDRQILTFSFTARPEPLPNLTSVPAFIAKAVLRAKIGDEEMVVESEESNTKILANIELDTLGSFTAGPNPPLPGQETTYAITWKLGPTSSELKDVVMAGVLPKGVQWKSSADYNLGELKYDTETKTVTWRVSKIPKLTAPADIRFVLGVTPSDQPTNNLVIFPQTTFSAVDALAGETLELFATGVTLGGIR
ncbi:MAG: hypothetical protein Q8L21_00920 [Candidatus Komeilibacteria bacterium]|nr:hypothetical protein [Candidatus Komeilibacteria bacterium]